MRNRLVAAILVLEVLGWSAAGSAQIPAPAPSVTLYEVTENVQFPTIDGVPVARDAVATLMGSATRGTPLCSPETLIDTPLCPTEALLAAQSCTVTGHGRDSVSLATGRGPVSGTFAVVVNATGNSSVHVPDCPVLTGEFEGEIDLSPALLFGIPMGYVRLAKFTIDQTGQVIPFSATVRMPFAAEGYYLADDGQSLIPVGPEERSLGFPTVRLDVTLQSSSGDP